MGVTILAEAGLSECAGHLETPVCKQMNDEMTIFFGLLFGIPTLLVVVAVVVVVVRARRSIGRLRNEDLGTAPSPIGPHR